MCIVYTAKCSGYNFGALAAQSGGWKERFVWCRSVELRLGEESIRCIVRQQYIDEAWYKILINLLDCPCKLRFSATNTERVH